MTTSQANAFASQPSASPPFLKRAGWVLLGTLAVMFANVLLHILYMVAYSYLIHPGEAQQFYEQHAQDSGPYSSIVAGLPLMYCGARWIAAKAGGSSPMRTALALAAAYCLIDIAVIVAMGSLSELAPVVAVSYASKFLGAYLGGRAVSAAA
jgi:hypothetical protein